MKNDGHEIRRARDEKKASGEAVTEGTMKLSEKKSWHLFTLGPGAVRLVDFFIDFLSSLTLVYSAEI